MRFIDLLKDTLEDYKKNFKILFKTFFWLYILPTILVFSFVFILIFPYIGSISSFNSSAIAETITKNMFSDTNNGITSSVVLLVILIVALTIFISYILHLTFYFISVQPESNKATLKQIVKGSFRYFWKFLGLIILISFLLLLFFLPAIIIFIVLSQVWQAIDTIVKVILILSGIILGAGGLTLAVYLGVLWRFSPYILFKENKKIIDSIKTSKFIVNRRWWRVFFYSILIGLITLAISWILAIPQSVLSFLITSIGTINAAYYMILFAVSFIIGLISKIIITPLSILFFKNFYTELRKTRK